MHIHAWVALRDCTNAATELFFTTLKTMAVQEMCQAALSRALSAAAGDKHSALIFSEHCQSVQLLIQPQFTRGWTWQIRCNYTELQLSSFSLFHLYGRQIIVCCVVLLLHLFECAVLCSVISRAGLRLRLCQRQPNSWTHSRGINLVVFFCNLHMQWCWD